MGGVWGSTRSFTGSFNIFNVDGKLVASGHNYFRIMFAPSKTLLTRTRTNLQVHPAHYTFQSQPICPMIMLPS